VVEAGCDSFRLSIEWARCEPAEGAIDDDAVDHYRQILEACHERNLEPLVTLHHFTHPEWAGSEFWLDLGAPERFARFCDEIVPRLADLVTNWVTLNELNACALGTWATGAFPPGRRLHTGATVRAFDHLLTAHVLGYEAIHHHQPGAVAAPNNLAFSIYEVDRLLADVLVARSRGIERGELRPWLTERRADWHLAMGRPSPGERLARRLIRSMIPLEQALPRAVGAVYRSDHERTLDVVQTDIYDPMVSHHVQPPGRRSAGGRTREPGLPLWDQDHDPGLFANIVRLVQEEGLDIWIVENGLCNRVAGRRSFPRLDGLDRPSFLRAQLGAVARLVDQGVPVRGYYHWTLGDNYEWGSYEPRFGLYGVERHDGGASPALAWSEDDAMGQPAAATYRGIIEGLRSGDRVALRPDP
jgi:beta-glucosidase